MVRQGKRGGMDVQNIRERRKILFKTYGVSGNCALLGYYAASGGEFLTDVSGQNIGPIFSDQEYKKQLPLFAT